MQRHIPFERLHNFRDLGGYPTDDGRSVRWGLVYRSDSLSKLDGDDLVHFRALGVRTVIDLRYPWEISAKGRVPAGDFTYHNLSIEHRPYDQPSLAADVDPVTYLSARFAEVLADGLVELREVLSLLASKGDVPVVFHCASGKDRTGIVAALLLSLLGVPEEDVIADFALTGLATSRLVADWRRDHLGADHLWPGYGQAPAALMDTVLKELKSRYGSVSSYALTELGVSPSTIADLRSRFLSS